jgi:putative ABC transport system permease protein
MKQVAFALRLLARDWRAGEMRVLAAALVIAVASMTSVGFFTDRIHVAMQQQTGELLGADLVLLSSAAPPAAWTAQADAHALRHAMTLSFPSVVLAGERTQLMEVKAVSSGYPLRGVLRVALTGYGVEMPTDSIPEAGTAWLDARALNTLGLVVGDVVRLGTLDIRVTKVLAYEPDRGGDFFSIAPRLLMNVADVPRTGLLGPGSRVSYRLLLAGRRDALQSLRDRLQPGLVAGQRFLDASDARPELKSALERAQRFLGLAALVSVILAGVAVASATRRYVARHLDSSALMRCFGATQNQITLLFSLQILVLGLVASLVGCALGYAAQEVLARLLAGIISGKLPAPSAWPVLVGVLTGLITLAGFSLPSLLRLKTVPPQRVLRRDMGPLPTRSITLYGAALAAMALLLVWQAADAQLAMYVIGGVMAALLVLTLSAYLLVRALGVLRGSVGVAWRYGMANIARRSGASVAQVAAFGIGIMLLLLLSLVRGDLLSAWERTLPQDAPNQFLINILPEQVPAVRQFLAQRLQDSGVTRGAPLLHPMVRARLTAINGREVLPEEYTDDRARRLLEREFNLSWGDTLQADNHIVAGQWWGRAGRGRTELSVEQGLATSLGLRLGDELTYRIADRELRVRITSLRTVSWDSFRANFFVLTPPGVLEDYPATYITSFYLPPTNRDLLGALVRAFPNVTIIDVDAMMTRVRSIMQRVNLSVQYVFLFTLLAGLTVMYAAIQSTRDERVHESALLRTLGASRRQLLQGLAAEFMLLGLLAGVLASFVATLAGYVIARQVFHFDYAFDPQLWLAGTLGGTLCVGFFGVWGTRFILHQPPLQVLREL